VSGAQLDPPESFDSNLLTDPGQTAVSAGLEVSANAVRAGELDGARRKAAAKRLVQALGDQVDQLGLDDAATETTHDGHIVKEPT
jgi:hypothetical protein